MGKTLFVGKSYRTLNDAKNGYDVFQFLKELADEFGFEKFSMLTLPTECSDELSPNFIVTNWPPALIRAYDDMGLLKNSPVIAKMRESLEPFEWELESVNQTRAQDEGENTISIFRKYNMLMGVYFPTYDNKGVRGAISFAGDRTQLEHDELATLHLLSLYAYNHISRISADGNDQYNKITNRERECLLWSANGKTNSEIATILSISENTVSSYMTSVMKKMNAVSKSHAVAQALRNGIIN